MYPPEPQKVCTFTQARKWLKVTGSDATRFLNGMFTCDFKRAVQNAPATGAGFLLGTKGKAICPIVFLCESENSFLLSIPKESADIALDTLSKYIIADDVELRFDDGPETMVGVVNSPLQPLSGDLKVAAPVPLAKDEIFRAETFAWGFRIARAQLGAQHEEWWLRVGATAPVPSTLLSEVAYTQLRIDYGVAEWGVDWTADNLPLEFPFAREISFFKGCYIGQEVIARATFRGHVTRVFARFRSEQALRADFIYTRAEPERPVGKITSVVGSQGLGLVRLNALENISELFQKNPDRSFSAVDALVDEKTYKG